MFALRTGESPFFDTSALLAALRGSGLTNAQRVKIQCAALSGGVPFQLVAEATDAGRRASAHTTFATAPNPPAPVADILTAMGSEANR